MQRKAHQIRSDQIMQSGIQGQLSGVGHRYSRGKCNAHRLSLATNILAPFTAPGSVNDPTLQGYATHDPDYSSTHVPDTKLVRGGQVKLGRGSSICVESGRASTRSTAVHYLSNGCIDELVNCHVSLISPALNN